MMLYVHALTPFSCTLAAGVPIESSAFAVGTMLPIVVRLAYNAMQMKLDAHELWMVITIRGWFIAVLKTTTKNSSIKRQISIHYRSYKRAYSSVAYYNIHCITPRCCCIRAWFAPGAPGGIESHLEPTLFRNFKTSLPGVSVLDISSPCMKIRLTY